MLNVITIREISNRIAVFINSLHECRAGWRGAPGNFNRVEKTVHEQKASYACQFNCICNCITYKRAINIDASQEIGYVRVYDETHGDCFVNDGAITRGREFGRSGGYTPKALRGPVQPEESRGEPVRASGADLKPPVHKHTKPSAKEGSVVVVLCGDPCYGLFTNLFDLFRDVASCLMHHIPRYIIGAAGNRTLRSFEDFYGIQQVDLFLFKCD